MTKGGKKIELFQSICFMFFKEARINELDYTFAAAWQGKRWSNPPQLTSASVASKSHKSIITVLFIPFSACHELLHSVKCKQSATKPTISSSAYKIEPSYR